MQSIYFWIQWKAVFSVFLKRYHKLLICNKSKNACIFSWILVITQKMPRSSHLQMFFKIAVRKNFVNFIGKHLYWSLFLIKFQTQRLATLLKRHQHRCFPVKFAKILRTPILQNTLGGCFWMPWTLRDHHYWGSFIWYVRKIFRKTNISYSLIRTRTYGYQGVRNLSFRKILCT